MTRRIAVTEENFEVLLGWLDRDREIAGEKYEKIRRRLIRIFSGRGCFEAEDLADRTINRVIAKLPQIIDVYEGEPLRYFYGVAHNIHLEWLRERKKAHAARFPAEEENHAESTVEYDCLETCLEKLSVTDRALIVEYYQNDKREKIESRRNLAEKLAISMNGLQVKVHRIRARLSECVRDCAQQ